MKSNIFFQSPINGFMIYKVDESDSTYNYYLFENIFGDYYIMRIEKDTNNTDYAYNQDENLETAWSNRSNLNYSKPSIAFSSLKS